MTDRAAGPAGSHARFRGVAGNLGRRVRAWLIALVAAIVGWLPEGFVLRVADVAGALWYRATPERAALARRQLARVVTELAARGIGSSGARAAVRNPRALERLVRAAYRHAARYYVEVMRTGGLDDRYIRERVLIETPDVVEEAFAGGRPIVFVAGHFGAVELPALYFATRTGRNVVGPMETVGDPHLQRWFVKTRGRVGIRIVGLREARRELTAALRAGESVGLVADRDLTGGGIEVSLFGHPARLPAGPALLALESGAPIYLASIRRDGPGRYRARLARIEVPADGTRRDRVTAVVQGFASALESVVALAPEQWWAVFFPIWTDLAVAPEASPRAANPEPPARREPVA